MVHYKTFIFRPVVPEILEDYEEFEDKIKGRKAKEYNAEREKVVKEHKRQIVNAQKRLKERNEQIEKREKQKKSEKEDATSKLEEKLKEEL